MYSNWQRPLKRMQADRTYKEYRKTGTFNIKLTSMIKQFLLLTFGIFLATAANAQQIKKQAADTVKAGRANDRLKNAGPKDGWPLEGNSDTVKKIKKPAETPRRTKQRSNR